MAAALVKRSIVEGDHRVDVGIRFPFDTGLSDFKILLKGVKRDLISESSS